MKRIHYLLTILAAMLVYAGKIWVIPLLPETITVDGKITIKKPILYQNILRKNIYVSDKSGSMILFGSPLFDNGITYDFFRYTTSQEYLSNAENFSGTKNNFFKINTCYLQEEQLMNKSQTLYQGYTMYAYPYVVSFHEIDYDRMADFMRQICKDENGKDRKIILLETKIQDQSHPPKSQIPLK